MTAPQPAPCPHCAERMPPGFLVCRACWRDLPFALRTEHFTAQSRAHFPEIYRDGPDRADQSTRRILAHLKTNSSAIL